MAIDGAQVLSKVSDINKNILALQFESWAWG
jgi:hypothetical protein